jgi:hypothetical protein
MEIIVAYDWKPFQSCFSKGSNFGHKCLFLDVPNTGNTAKFFTVSVLESRIPEKRYR